MINMLNKLKQAVEASIDTVAPPIPLHDDFVYHWKRFMKHYLNLSHDCTAAVELTCLPECLDRLRNILIEEDEEMSNTIYTSEIGPCMEYFLKNSLLDLLTSLAISDEPPGMKSCVLRFISKTLTQLREPNIAHSAFYVPLMKLVNVCDGLLHSVSEVDEIEFLLHLCVVLKKQPAVAVLFFSNESARTLEETTETGDFIQYASVLDLVLSYVDSADCGVRVKACQCIQLLCSMDDETIVRCIVNNSKFDHFIIGRLTTLFFEVTANDYEKFKDIEASWTLDVPQESQLQVINNRSAIVFFSWLDFINQLCLECHDTIKIKLKESIDNYFLKESFELKFLSSRETIAILCKYHRMITSPILRNGFQTWVIRMGEQNDALNIITLNPILQTLLDCCDSNDDFFVITCLDFFKETLYRCDEHIIYNLVLCHLNDRAYYDRTAVTLSWSDEEDERQKVSGSSDDALSSSRTLAPSNVDKVVQSFINIIPIQLHSYSSADTIRYVQKEYDEVISRCSQFQWPVEATSDTRSSSNDSSPKSNSRDKCFSEGPFLNMIFAKIQHFPLLTLEQMLCVNSIICRLALLPHPFLHEYLLNPLLPLSKDVLSLHTSLSGTMKDVCLRLQTIPDYEHELRMTKKRLMSEEIPSSTREETERHLEAYVLLEELCNYLATIVYVKYAHCHSN